MTDVLDLPKIKGAVIRAAHGDFEMTDLAIEAPRAGEVLVRIVGVGICHTDLAARDQIIPVRLPAVLGHEGSGIVERVGADVDDFAPGDRVVLSYLACGHCDRCAVSEASYCTYLPQLNFLGSRLDGSTSLRDEAAEVGSHFFGQSSFATHCIADRRNLVKVDSALPLELLGPLGCGIQTGAGTVFNVMAPNPTASIAVFGGGAVGLSAILAAASIGCVRIALVDPMPSRRQAALELGATEVYDSADPDIAQKMTAEHGGFDFTLDTSGAPPAISTAIGVTRTRGECVLVGSPSVPGQTFPVRTGLFVQKGITLRGVMEGNANPQQFIPWLLNLQAEGKFPFERLLKTYRFDQINEAVADQAAGLCIKPVLVM